MNRCLKTGPFPIGGTLQRALNKHAERMKKRIHNTAVWMDGRMQFATSDGSRTEGGRLRRRLRRLTRWWSK